MGSFPGGGHPVVLPLLDRTAALLGAAAAAFVHDTAAQQGKAGFPAPTQLSVKQCLSSLDGRKALVWSEKAPWAVAHRLKQRISSTRQQRTNERRAFLLLKQRLSSLKQQHTAKKGGLSCSEEAPLAMTQQHSKERQSFLLCTTAPFFYQGLLQHSNEWRAFLL